MLVDFTTIELGRRVLGEIELAERRLADCAPEEVEAAEAALALGIEEERLRGRW